MPIDLEYIIDKYSFQMKSSSAYCSPNIPIDKAMNAISSYANSISVEDIVFLFDDTVFGSAKYGFLVTLDRFFSREFTEKPKTINLKVIDNISNSSGVINKTIIINGAKIFTSSSIDKETMTAVTNMIKDLIKLKDGLISNNDCLM